MLLLSCAVKAQINLVLNPGFEQYTDCPYELDQVKYSNYWNGLDTIWDPHSSTAAPWGLPDYMNGCSSLPQTTIPNNYYFYHYAHGGNGMMQVQMYFSDTSTAALEQSRDYLQGNLSQTLISGHLYSVFFM